MSEGLANLLWCSQALLYGLKILLHLEELIGYSDRTHFFVSSHLPHPILGGEKCVVMAVYSGSILLTSSGYV